MPDHTDERRNEAPSERGTPPTPAQAIAALGLLLVSGALAPRRQHAQPDAPAIDPEKQLAFFKILYDEEVSREKQLNDHAKNNLALVTLYSGFVIFVTEKLKPTDFSSKVLFGLAAASMVGAFLFSLRSSAIAEFEAINDAEAVATSYAERPSAATFCDDRIADYVVATRRNGEVNDRKAFRLRIAGYLLLAGLVFHGLYFAIQVTVTPTTASLPQIGGSTPGQTSAPPKIP